jgi:hypothetical protein
MQNEKYLYGQDKKNFIGGIIKNNIDKEIAEDVKNEALAIREREKKLGITFEQ